MKERALDVAGKLRGLRPARFTSTHPSPDSELTTDAARQRVERAYRLLLNRAPEPDTLESLTRRIANGTLATSTMCSQIAASEEFTTRLDRLVSTQPSPSADRTDDHHARERDDVIDVAEFLAATDPADLLATAEHYFLDVVDEETVLAKPFKDVTETPEVLASFGQALRGLELSPGMTVVDFGAGACWTTHALAQLGCAVTAVDVAQAGLDMGKRLFERHPPFGDTTPPTFLHFDGDTLDISDASVDRVLCFDAFHHVGNPDRIIEEFGRILKPGGMATFSEPGPEHSLSGPSQFAMRHWGVLENDVELDALWPTAAAAGFERLDVCLHDPYPEWVDPATFDAVLRGDVDSTVQADPSRKSMKDRRLFRFVKPGSTQADSRVASGLAGTMAASDMSVRREDGRILIDASISVENTGTRTWLPADAGFGGVTLGIRSHVDDATSDLFHAPIQADVVPGHRAVVEVSTSIDDPDERIDTLDFDLLSQDVTWFSRNGSPTLTVIVEN